MTEEDRANQVLEKLLAFHKEAQALAAGYEQVILAAGFAGFLTIWAQTAPHLPRAQVLLSGGLIGVSLLLYVAFHLLQTAVRAKSQLRLGRRLADAAADTDVHLKIFTEESLKSEKDFGLVRMAWPIAFFGSTILGVAAAIIVIGTAFWGVVSRAI